MGKLKCYTVDPSNIDTFFPHELQKEMTEKEFEDFMKFDDDEIDIDKVQFRDPRAVKL